MYGFDATGEMELRSVHPSVTVEQVLEKTGWEMKVSRGLTETAPPTAEELRLIREELDPDGTYTR